jgi:hypothetical protein
MPPAQVLALQPDQRLEIKRRELDLKEREVSAKEREVEVRQRELNRTRWWNPITLGVVAGVVGLLANAAVAYINNRATRDVERMRAQAELALDAIRTGTGNTDAACKNLLFLVNLRMVDDLNSTIRSQCEGAKTGPPSLPSSTELPLIGRDLSALALVSRMGGRVIDGNTFQPIEGAKVAIEGKEALTNNEGQFEMEGQFNNLLSTVTVSKVGYRTHSEKDLLTGQMFITLYRQ